MIHKVNWDEVCSLNNNDPNISCKKFIDTITFYLDEYAPYRKLSKKEVELLEKPWITSEILNKCHERDLLLKTISKEKDPIKLSDLKNKFKAIRNEITKDKRKGKKLHYEAYFQSNKNRTAKIWEGVRAIVNTSTSKSSNIKLMDRNHNLVSDNGIIANTFNRHFSTIGSNVGNLIPQGNGSFRDYFTLRDTNNRPFLDFSETFFLNPAVPDEVTKVIDSLNLKKSVGPMSIPTYILKLYKQFFSHYLAILINMSFETGIFPDVLKIAKVTPIHKKESKLDYLNYRPISLLSAISKIYEKLIYTRIFDYLTKNNMISSKQFGFRSKYSTIHAIISLTERIKELMDSGHYVCGIFIDLEKAFDTVNHNILCHKLNYYGLRGNINNLIQSYLTNRKQFVSIKGVNSDTMDVNCGVPQGSSLGPLLFLIYINDFRFCLKQTETGHFADDTYILYASKKLKSLEVVINSELKLVTNWLRLNRLSLNAKKTELIIFRSKRKPIYCNTYFKLNGILLKPKDSVKYLGMHIDKHLTWDTHILNLGKSLSRANGILSKLRHYSPKAVCLNVYYALFYSHLTYGACVWGLTSEKNIKKIEVLQNKCARILTFSDSRSSANPLYTSLGLLKVRDIFKFQQLNLAYDFDNNLLPDDLCQLFIRSTDMTTTNMTLGSHRNNLLKLPLVKTDHSGKKSLRFQCASVWNEFSSSTIKLNCTSSLDFNKINGSTHLKNLLKKHFKFMYTQHN